MLGECHLHRLLTQSRVVLGSGVWLPQCLRLVLLVGGCKFSLLCRGLPRAGLG